MALRPEQGDDLVLIALARMLSVHFAHSSVFLEQSFGFRADRRVFYGRLVGGGRVRKLFKLDLTNQISRTRKLKSLVRDRYVFDLVSSFLAIPILDKKGKDWSTGAGIPPADLTL